MIVWKIFGASSQTRNPCFDLDLSYCPIQAKTWRNRSRLGMSYVMPVFHYGDSQLEGDRMTSYIRDRLQKRFGGYGLGMVPASHNNQVKLLLHETSDNWYWYPSFFKSGADGGNNKYAALTSYGQNQLLNAELKRLGLKCLSKSPSVFEKGSKSSVRPPKR